MRACALVTCLLLAINSQLLADGAEINVCANPGFEIIDPGATHFPIGWVAGARPAGEAGVTVDKDTHSGGVAVRMWSVASGMAALNSDMIPARKGVVGFYYKAVASSRDGDNLRVYILGMSKSGVELVEAAAYVVPKEHVGDGQWHQGKVAFDLSYRSDAVGIIIAPRVNERMAGGEGEWLLDDFECFMEEIGVSPVIEAFTIPDLVLRVGKASELILQIANNGDKSIGASVVKLSLPAEVALADRFLGLETKIEKIDPGKSRRLVWKIVGKKQANVDLEVTWTAQDFNLSRIRKTACVATDNPRALYTAADGSWRLMPGIQTLQKGNTARLIPLATKRSFELPDSMIGVTAQLPRSEDFEKIFDPAHLIDGDWGTSWSGRCHTSPVPGTVDWVQLNLGSRCLVKEVKLVPYWHAQGFPVDFEIKARSAKSWKTVHAAEHVWVPESSGMGRKQPYRVALEQPVATDALRIEATRLSRATFPFDNSYYMCLSEIEVIDDRGRNVALASSGCKVSASSTNYNLFNTAKVLNETYPMVYDLGFKWNRVGFWGDMTTWGQVERKKGEYYVDPEMDRAITESVRNGVNILYCLCWGNSLYQTRAGADEPPTWRALPFTWEVGPTTEESMKGFVDYVRFVARHFKGRVKHWEIWNEENSWGWYGVPPDPKLFGILVREAAKALKEIDPGNYVVFGGTAALAPTFLDDALKEGAGPYINAVAYHPYGSPYPELACGGLDVVNGQQVAKGPQEYGITTFEDMLAFLKSITAKYNPRVEIWADEWCPVPTREDTPALGMAGCSELTHAKYVARYFLLGTLKSVPSIYYCMHSNCVFEQGILRSDLSKRPLYYTTQAMTTLLSGAKPDQSLKATAFEEGSAGIRSFGDLTAAVVRVKVPVSTTSRVRLTNVVTFNELELFDSSAQESVNLARLGTARSSSSWDASYGPEKGIDGDSSSRFSAKTADDEWYEVDWGTDRTFDTVVLHQWPDLLHKKPLGLEVWDSSSEKFVPWARIGKNAIRCETLRGRDGEAMVWVWCPVESKDDFPATSVSVRVNVAGAKAVQAVDTLHVLCQDLQFRAEGGETVIDHVLVGDYPIAIQVLTS